MASKDGPPARGKSSVQFSIHEDGSEIVEGSSAVDTTISSAEYAGNSKDGTIPLVSGKLGNISSSNSRSASATKSGPSATESPDPSPADDGMDALLAKLSEHQFHPTKAPAVASATKAETGESASNSVPRTPATEAFSTTPPTETSGETSPPAIEKNEMQRLKMELDAAKNQIALQEQELSNTRQALDQSKSGQSGVSASLKPEGTERAIGGMLDAFAASRPKLLYVNQEDARSDVSDAISTGAFNDRGPSAWAPNAGLATGGPGAGSVWNPGANRSWLNRPVPHMQPIVVPPPQSIRAYSGASSPVSNGPGKTMGEFPQFHSNNVNRRGNMPTMRTSSVLGQPRGSGWDFYGANGDGPSFMGMPGPPIQPMGMFSTPMSYPPRPLGSQLSPTAAEFTSTGPAGPWNSNSSSPGQTYVAPMEPLNYRRLLDRSVTCNWKYIVDKIVCNNDQQASIFLQQKLKVGTAEQKFEIVEAIVAQAYPLMVNRFGNFLVQRCFEHGTPEQVVAIANAIRGNTLSLSMDAFGCHVVQKAFDAVPEEYKAIMVHELLRRIPETVIHRYACHVWQKLFELRWSDSPPQIMKYVNEALRNMWHEVALGETGSLVVQNIFENCLEEDKRPCIDEVLQSIDIVAHGQFGNWCIQHICEHGAPADRSRAIDHVLRYATEYSMDQFASKVVEKCLKIGGTEFLERYLERVCEGRPDRPRIPLIDISSDQYGNYLIQYILTHANAQHREVVASHIRKHMVSLRGSKFGSRVGLLCCNPAYATRPGPAIGSAPNRFNGVNSVSTARYGGPFR